MVFYWGRYNCFRRLCQFLLYNEVNQLYVYIYTSPLNLFPTHPLSDSSRSPRSASSAPCCRAGAHQRSISHAAVDVWQGYFLNASPTGPTHPLPTFASLFLPCKWVHQYHFPDSTRLRLYTVFCFSFSDLLHSVRQTLGPSTALHGPYFQVLLPTGF